MITVETAKVYKANGKRFFTLAGAASELAKAKMRERCDCDPGDGYVTPPYTCIYHDHNNRHRFETIRRRLSRMYKSAYRQSKES